MDHTIGPILAAILVATVAVTVLILGVSAYRRYLGIPRSRAAAFFVVAVVAGVVLAIRGVRTMDTSPDLRNVKIFVTAGCALADFLLPVIATPFLVRLYLKWIGGQLTDAEKSTGMDGVRAWLQGGNAVCALLIALGAWFTFACPFFSVLALELMALLAYPVLNMASASFQPVEPKTDNLAPEREKVLKMLEDGKITATDSAELLNALHEAPQPRAPQNTASGPQRKMVLAGLVLLLIGFFLPWFSYNPGEEMNRMMGQVQQQIGQTMHESNFHIDVPVMTTNTGTVRVAGGDIKYGLGWCVLLLGIAAAILPYLAENLDPQTRQKAVLIGLSIGGIILIYLLTQSVRYASVGIMLGLAGYALQLVGTLKERQMLLR